MACTALAATTRAATTCSTYNDHSGEDLSFERDLDLRVPLHGCSHLKVLLVGCLRATLRISAIAIGTNNLVGTLPASLSVLTKLEYVPAVAASVPTIGRTVALMFCARLWLTPAH